MVRRRAAPPPSAAPSAAGARPRRSRHNAKASETPHEYAHRIAAREPALAEAVWGLTRLYEPVRYGGLADEAEAAAAEAWLRRIEKELEKGEET
ncbi:DUF4129 domain-containing protein [Oceanithermus sp.]|uniref:DUF4129 domain-containing protein n=1 Tax=Oceanithermus sp. TaxID=2268145 RepID=UPI00257D0AB5|nr:DUF4129 domain-containing protein [Oceanithermus sp.]